MPNFAVVAHPLLAKLAVLVNADTSAVKPAVALVAVHIISAACVLQPASTGSYVSNHVGNAASTLGERVHWPASYLLAVACAHLPFVRWQPVGVEVCGLGRQLERRFPQPCTTTLHAAITRTSRSAPLRSTDGAAAVLVPGKHATEQLDGEPAQARLLRV